MQGIRSRKQGASAPAGSRMEPKPELTARFDNEFSASQIAWGAQFGRKDKLKGDRDWHGAVFQPLQSQNAM